MFVETSQHNTYSYLRQTGEIVSGVVDDSDYVWSFDPLKPFIAMPDLDMFILGITEQCNLCCKYCCYSGEYTGNRTHSALSMNQSDIDDIYIFINKMSTKRPLYIAFYGGEPLTHFGLVQYAIMKAIKLWHNEVFFSITTNATLLSEEKADWLIKHRVKLETSIDGTASFHDRNRVNQSGRGSFARVHQALSYIFKAHADYLPNVKLLMTLPSVDDLTAIAEDWSNDDILRHIAPSHITGIAPNFAKGVEKKDYKILKDQYLQLLEIYEQHQDWLVLKSFFDSCISDWRDRPIVNVDKTVPMSTCMPRNNKLYIDARKQIAVCEKISDRYRIGDINNGIDWEKANEHAYTYYNIRYHRCVHCPAIRMCDLCLTAIEYNEDQWDVLCHNERVYARLYMFLFCEMAERRLIG